VVALTVATVTAAPPNDAVAPAWKSVPVIVTEVPPAVAPVLGATDVTLGGGTGPTYVKQLVHVPVCVSGFVTVTVAAPATCAAVVPVMLVALTAETASADPPNDTVAPVTKSLPAIVTVVPPAVAPLLGATDVTVGGGAGATYVKQLEHVPVCASGFVTVTSTAPAACAVVEPVMVVALTVETVSAEPPNDTVAPAWKLLPAIVTAVPPALAPLFGVTDVIAGAGGAPYVKQPVHVPLCVSGLVTTTLTAPTACAVVVPVMLVALTVETVSAEPPNEIVAPVWKPVPLTLTAVPPDVRPLFGVTEVTTGGGVTNVKQPVQVPLCASRFVTTTFTAPVAWAVVVPVMLVAVTVETVSGDPPSETLAPDWKPVPFTVTAVPPPGDPLFGVTDVTAGGGPITRRATCWITQLAFALNVIDAAGRMPVAAVRLSAA